MTTRQRVIAGVIAAPLIGGLLGLAFGPKLDTRQPMEPASAERIQVVVGQAPNAPIPGGDGRLDVLTSRPIAGYMPASAPPAAIPASAGGRDVSAVESAEPVVSAPPIQPRARPSFDCAQANSAAEEEICADAELAAADRRMARAWDRADRQDRRARREQRQWLEERDAMAREAPDRLPEMYDRRTRDLEEQYEGPPEGYEG